MHKKLKLLANWPLSAESFDETTKVLIFSPNGPINDGTDVPAHKSFSLKLSLRLYSVVRTRWPSLNYSPRTGAQDSSFHKTRSNSGNVNLISQRTIRRSELREPRFPPLSSFPLSRDIWITVSNWRFPGGGSHPDSAQNTPDGGRQIKCLRKHQTRPAVNQKTASAARHAWTEHGRPQAWRLVPVGRDWRLSRTFNYRPRQFGWKTNPWAPKHRNVSPSTDAGRLWVWDGPSWRSS